VALAEHGRLDGVMALRLDMGFKLDMVGADTEAIVHERNFKYKLDPKLI
jgi:hypothetical protein